MLYSDDLQEIIDALKDKDVGKVIKLRDQYTRHTSAETSEKIKAIINNLVAQSKKGG